MRKRWLLLSVFALLLLVLPFLALRWLGGRGMPRRSGEAQITALSAPVEVRYDEVGVPHLSGESGVDLAAALGYVHANDRFTQMELGRRAAAGRLSELFGDTTLASDRHFRTLRLRKAAERMWAELEGESRDWLLAYADGVNAWLEERDGDLPPELVVLRLRPEPWQPVDSLGFVYLMANELSFWNGRPEEERFVWLRQLGAERTLDLIGADRGAPAYVPPELLGSLDAASGETEGAAAPGTPPGQGPLGSNNWALDSARSRSGSPLVANDPHLPLRLPAVWYQVLIRAPDYEVAGWSLPGLPGVVVGQSEQLAWAVTNAMLDDHDLFFEELDEEDRVRRGQSWEPTRSELETIQLRGGQSVPIRLLSTDHGPLLEADLERRVPPRSLRWTLYEGGDPLGALIGLARCETLEEVPAAIESYVGPAQNLVVAHREGGLLYTLLGRLPERLRGDGRLPSPGWEPSYGWTGLRPAAANPRLLLPPEGLVVTANHDTRPADYEEPYVADFDLPFRARRIEERLLAREQWSVQELAELQTDVVSAYALAVIGLLPGGYQGAARDAFDVLQAWDGRMSTSGASALWALFERNLGASLFADEAVRYSVTPFGQRERVLRALEGGMPEAWLDDVTTPEVEAVQEVSARALALAWQQGVERWGPEVFEWSYAELHPLQLRHPASQMPIIGAWYDRGPYEVAGSATTVAAFGVSVGSDVGEVAYGPSMRFVADVADPDRSLVALPGGQSGHPKDPHYDDQIDAFVAGATRPLRWSEEAIAGATVSTLRLRP